jgi:hypothetical protein
MRTGGDFWHNAAKRGMARNLAVYDRGQDLCLGTRQANNRSRRLITAGFKA